MQKSPSVSHRSPEGHEVTMVVTGLPSSLMSPKAKCNGSGGWKTPPSLMNSEYD